jgi:2-oxo-4-hydroxy-4-carboxy-5-ureidoimidazoline decarboxylase
VSVAHIHLPGEGIGLTAFNALPADAAEHLLRSCCSSPVWAEGVASRRPFAKAADLFEAADDELAALGEGDVDEALSGHPRIGERPQGAGGAQSRREQSGVDGAQEETLAAIAEGNRAYERRFGHVYLVCATGRSADELLEVLCRRLDNPPETERRVLREELAKINRIRLGRMLGEADG